MFRRGSMKTLLLLSALFFVGCSRKINTTVGVVEIDKSFDKFEVSRVHKETYTKSETEGCTKCGFCYSAMEGGFTMSCLCSGNRDVEVEYTVEEAVYKYSDTKKTYTTVPEREYKRRTLSGGSCY